MTDQFAFFYPSPLEGYENLPPLPEERNEDGKSFRNPQHGILSKAYEEFPDPLEKGHRGGFDIHIYHYQVGLLLLPLLLPLHARCLNATYFSTRRRP
ncbi:dopa 4,5-dioxygenase family domain-containing protein [Histoplasma capsulatum]|uniref:Dopa 4,5-dioxygenase family domain-containing protein n=1 Tax=Ajellomyces capsulatus TaxID=5037 RepID=A0A8A1MG06_AJECA|nr:dopa 4,5-dioxygenase family domain-containing protein [Histoplasma capsulatum]